MAYSVRLAHLPLLQLIGQDGDAGAERLGPGELQGLLLSFPEQQPTAADQDGMDREPEFVD
jgi:hypothetical protein